VAELCLAGQLPCTSPPVVLGALFSRELIESGRVRARGPVPRRRGSRAPVVFLLDHCMRRLGTASVLGSVPAASINPAAELCLAGRPRSRHLLGSLVFGLLMRSPWEIHSAQVATTSCMILAGTLKTNSGATRLEVGPRESRAGSRVPIYTSFCPAVQATCQDGAVHAPEFLPEGNSHPRTSGSPMLRAGGRHGRGAAMPTQEWKHHAPRW
jgi:hypothetical protein